MQSADIGATKRLDTGNGLVIEVPEDWEWGERKRGDWWFEAANGTATLYVKVGSRDIPDGPEEKAVRAEAGLDRWVEETLGFLEGHALPGSIAVLPQPGGKVVRATVDHVEDGVEYRNFRWYAFIRVEGSIACLGFTLAVREVIAGHPLVRAWVELFERQALRASAVEAAPDRPEPEALATYDFDGLIDLRLPATWAIRIEGPRRWQADLDDPPVTVRFAWDFVPCDEEKGDEENHAVSLEALTRPLATGTPRTNLSVDGRQRGMVVICQTVEEDAAAGPGGRRRRYYGWHMGRSREEDVVVFGIELAVDVAEAQVPAVTGLIELIGRETENAALKLPAEEGEEPDTWEELDDGGPLPAPLKQVVTDTGFRIRVPAEWEERIDEYGDWTCGIQDATPWLGFLVDDLHVHPDLDRPEVPPAEKVRPYAEALREQLGSDSNMVHLSVHRREGGYVLKLLVKLGIEGGDPVEDGPFHMHQWMVLVGLPTGAKMIRYSLTIFEREKDAEWLPPLLRLFTRESRQLDRNEIPAAPAKPN